MCPRPPEQAAFLCFWPSTRKTMVSYQLRTSSPLRTVAIPSLLLNGETLATISFEELCAGGLGRGGESFRLPPGWGESGKAAAVAGASYIRVDWRGRSIFALFLRCAVRSNFSIWAFHPMQILESSHQQLWSNLLPEFRPTSTLKPAVIPPPFEIFSPHIRAVLYNLIFSVS